MHFERVTYTAFSDDIRDYYPTKILPEVLFELWNRIKIPERKTKYSAGYDICTPVGIVIPPHERRVIPTGIKAVFLPV